MRARRIVAGVRRRLGLRPPSARVVSYAGDLRLHADPADLIERAVYTTGEYEREIADVIARVLRPGDVCVDVGAHVGCHTLIAARAVGPTGQVVALEPNPSSASRLRRNLALNGFESRVHVIEAAASDEAGMAVLYPSDDPTNSGGASLGGQATPTTGFAVRCDTLDHLVDESLAARATLVKVDVEGFESRALAGARHLVSRHPAVVYESNSSEPADLLRAAGFELYVVGGDRLALTRLAERDLGRVVAPGRGVNVVALWPGSTAYDRLSARLRPD